MSPSDPHQLRLLRIASLRADVSEAWNHDAPLQHALKRCAEAMVVRLDAVFARIRTLRPNERALDLQAEAMAPGVTAAPDPSVLEPEGLLRVACEREPAILAAIEGASRVTDPEWARGAGVGGFAAWPLVSAGRSIGVVSVATRHAVEQGTLEALATAAELIGAGIERVRAIEALRRSEARLRLLVEASAVLSSSLDYEQTLASVAKLVVPGMADWCSVHLTEGESNLARELVTAHKDPAKVEWARELGRKYPADPAANTGAFAVIRTGRAELYPDIPDEMLVKTARDEGQLKIMREVGFNSAMVVPLTARARTFGAITFVAAESGRRYDENDLAMAKELAERAAYAVDNARLYRDAQEAIRLRDEFLSIASHELKTPLTPLHLHLDSIRRISEMTDGPGSEKVLQRLDTMMRQVGRLETLVNGLLEIGRITNGRFALDQEELDASEVVREVVARFSESSRHAGSELRLHSDGEARGTFDRMRLEQVVTNLVSNALKFGGGKPIDVSVREDAERVVITVRDQGIGISLEDQARIFGRFERAVPTRHYGGFGLGLWIVKQIVDAMGGRVTVDSTPGEGAAFSVDLPRGEHRSTTVQAPH